MCLLLLESRGVLVQNSDGRQTGSEVNPGREVLVLGWVTTFKQKPLCRSFMHFKKVISLTRGCSKCGLGGCWYCPLHASSALVSFGSDDLNESLPQRANSQFARTADTSGDRRVVKFLPSLCCCSVWLNVPSDEEQIRSSHGRRTRVEIRLRSLFVIG